jgi:Mg2+ and Co2+ transporter CorA
MKGTFYIQKTRATANNTNACGGAVNPFHSSADLFFFWLQPILISSKTTFTPPQEKNLSLNGNEKPSQSAEMRAQIMEMRAQIVKMRAQIMKMRAQIVKMCAQIVKMRAHFEEMYTHFEEMYTHFEEMYTHFEEMYTHFEEMYTHFEEMYTHFEEVCPPIYGIQANHNSLRVLYIIPTIVNI